MPETKKNKKDRIFIIENSTSSQDRNKKTQSFSKKRKKNKKKNTQKRKKFFIVETSSSTGSKIKIDGKKIDFFNSETAEDRKDLKITSDIPKMERMNEKYIDLMERLSDIMLKQGEPFRARAYQKAQETIMAFPNDIKSPSQLKGMQGIGSTIMEKLEEYTKTGTLKVLEREKNNPVNILSEVYGIGPKKAKELVDAGITTIEELRENQHLLNDIQKVGLQYYEDILKRIPRSEIDDYKTIFEKTFEKVSTPNSHFEIVGSYRRGAQSSGDIDVIITSDNNKVFTNFINTLIANGVITNVLSNGPTKCLVIAKIPSSDAYRRVDFLYSSQYEYPFSVLYFTGSKIFNTVMRHQALSMGLTMNEHGLYKMIGKTKGEKVAHVFRDERDIFDYLNMEYKQPHERIDGRSVVIKSELSKTEEKKKTITEKNKKSMTKTKTKKRFIIEDEDEDENQIIETSEKNYEEMIQQFKQNGISVLQELNNEELSQLILVANKAYYNETPLMSDNEYDIVKDFIVEKYPSNKIIHEIGAPVERNKATLPYQMWSMDKIKPDTMALTNWKNKFTGPYVLSCKLDGVSGLYTTEGNQPKLYTRGNGTVGQDVSHINSHLRLPKTKNVVIRGEFIIPKTIFEEKYKGTFANPRNMVAGLINHKTISAAISDVHFVAYELIKPVMKPSEQMAFLTTLDVEVVLNETVPNISNEFLSQKLIDWRHEYPYEIDGIIVADDKIYERKSGNPEHAFAFKMVLSDQIAEAKVVDVIWNASKDGYLKPRVQIEPIYLGGVKIEFATGFNGAFIYDNKIGVGSLIELIRSGDVIPHIRKVITPSEQAKMPHVPFKWNETHIDIMLEDLETDETVREKLITNFFRTIGVEGLSGGNVARIIDAGYDTIPKIIKMTIDDFMTVEGFKTKMSNKIYDGIRNKLDAASLVTIMAASNMFGRGFSEKKIELIMDGYPTVLLSSASPNEKIERLSSIKGMAAKTAQAFVERIPDFLQFMKDAGLVQKLQVVKKDQAPLDETHPLYQKIIVMTGFRDSELQEALKNVGAKLGSSVSKNTFAVLVKNMDEDTGKAADARKLDIPLMTPIAFKSKYFQ